MLRVPARAMALPSACDSFQESCSAAFLHTRFRNTACACRCTIAPAHPRGPVPRTFLLAGSSLPGSTNRGGCAVSRGSLQPATLPSQVLLVGLHRPLPAPCLSPASSSPGPRGSQARLPAASLHQHWERRRAKSIVHHSHGYSSL